MKRKEKSLISSYYAGNINKKEFLQIYFNNKSPDDEHVAKLFRRGISDKDADLIEEAVVLLHTDAFSLSAYAAYLSNLLLDSWHTKHEDIATLLKKLANPSTAENLYRATELKFEYLDYDDTFQLSRKCIKALSQIKDEKSIEKIKRLSYSENIVISKYAKKELLHLGLL